MTSNERNLDEASARTQAFYVEREPQRLEEARMALEGVALSRRDPPAPATVRARALDHWLRLLSIIDARVDPQFDRSKAPFLFVPCPELPGGVRYPGACDPADIPDPAERAKYEAAVAKNRAENEEYYVQERFHLLNEDITPSAERFIQNAYTSDPNDQAELRAAIDQIITNPARRAGLSKLLSPPRP